MLALLVILALYLAITGLQRADDTDNHTHAARLQLEAEATRRRTAWGQP